jgi:hypothetical protein
MRAKEVKGRIMGRKILAVVVGVIAAFLVVMAFEFVGHRVWPLPANLDWKSATAVAAFMASLPVIAYLWLLLGWAVALAVGVILCARIAVSSARWPQWATAALFLAATASNFFILPHPAWFVAATAIVLAFAAWCAVKFSSAKKVA